MSASFRLGTVWGIPIGLHWSLLLVFGLLTWSLAVGYFPVEYPLLGDATRWFLAIVTGVLFFASITLHELGHAWVALREKIPVNGITLFIFGGVAEIGAPTRTPGAEFRIAVGGPIVSFALFLVFSLLSRVAQGLDLLEAPSEWLARINLMLLLFNLIPGYPLDGGRVLRATVWQLTGSEKVGWRTAMISGQLVAFGFMGFGAFLIANNRIADGIWLIFIGWFLQNATAAEQTSKTVQNQLAGATVAQAMGMVEEPRVPSRIKLRQLIDDYVLARGQSYFLIVDDELPRGVVTLADVAKVPREQWDWTSVAEVMTPWARLNRVAPRMDLLDALRLMETQGQGPMPVVDGDRLVGLLTREEILRFLRLRAELGAPA